MNNININKNSTQSGRSMIEMLGVLAIVGVLSVGGIAGYSKAMEKFKINKTIDQISQIATNIRTLYAQQTTYAGLNGQTAYDMGVIPDELGSYDRYGEFTNAFNGIINIASLWELNNKAFQITYAGLQENACIALATQDWGSGHSSGLISIVVNGGDVSPAWNGSLYDDTGQKTGFNCKGGQHYSWMVACPNGSAVSIPMPPTIATQVCKNCSESQYGCGIALNFY